MWKKKDRAAGASETSLYEGARRVVGTFNGADAEGRMGMLRGMNASFAELGRIGPEYRRYSTKEQYRLGQELLSSLEDIKEHPLAVQVGASAVALWLIAGAVEGDDAKNALELYDVFFREMVDLKNMLIETGVI
ncbi:MAG: hypothetical protein EOS63_04945 [Mesorhizobium sp.]|uniref:hypothetical protein n=1 Tax=Mesorhizobium sp. TaxID=1871066 RepID=UPI000FE6F019|nr:hypothetical protein [Mesorhizobium sp.]RWE83474.1 MAG: hypothetical protein EOS63_04945 [Mesorhizobium sp.]TJW61346.1 MAG: hypothetical protein E5V97_20835 [Mesorhizobium sp.]